MEFQFTTDVCNFHLLSGIIKETHPHPCENPLRIGGSPYAQHHVFQPSAQYRTTRAVFYPCHITASIILGTEWCALCPACRRHLCNFDDTVLCRPNSQGDKPSITSHNRKGKQLLLPTDIIFQIYLLRARTSEEHSQRVKISLVFL